MPFENCGVPTCQAISHGINGDEGPETYVGSGRMVSCTAGEDLPSWA